MSSKKEIRLIFLLRHPSIKICIRILEYDYWGYLEKAWAYIYS